MFTLALTHLAAMSIGACIGTFITALIVKSDPFP